MLKKTDGMSQMERDLMVSVKQAKSGQSVCVHTPEDIQARRRGRPAGSTAQVRKVSTTIRFDPEVLEGLKATGRGWQTRANNILREWLRQQHRA